MALTLCFNSNRVIKAARASLLGKGLLGVNTVGSKLCLDWFLALRKLKRKHKGWKRTPPNRDLASAGMMSLEEM